MMRAVDLHVFEQKGALILKWFHFYENGRIRLGVQTLGGPVDIAATAARRHLAAPADLHELLAGGDDALAQVERLLAGKTVPVAQPVRYAPAVPRPGKILCVGLNYRDHTAEIAMDKPERPVLFAKFGNTIAAHRQDIPFPEEAAKLDYEAELVAVVGRGGSHIAEEDAPAHIFGYTVGNDVSERVLQFQSTQWLMGKSWDHFAPIGPYVVTADEVDAGNLDIACRVNGEVRQRANTRDMLFTPAAVLAYVSRYITLEPGDILFTGTPGGVMQGRPPKEQHWLRPGDVVEADIQGIGTLQNRFV